MVPSPLTHNTRFDHLLLYRYKVIDSKFEHIFNITALCTGTGIQQIFLEAHDGTKVGYLVTQAL